MEGRTENALVLTDWLGRLRALEFVEEVRLEPYAEGVGKVFRVEFELEILN